MTFESNKYEEKVFNSYKEAFSYSRSASFELQRPLKVVFLGHGVYGIATKTEESKKEFIRGKKDRVNEDHKEPREKVTIQDVLEAEPFERNRKFFNYLVGKRLELESSMRDLESTKEIGKKRRLDEKVQKEKVKEQRVKEIEREVLNFSIDDLKEKWISVKENDEMDVEEKFLRYKIREYLGINEEYKDYKGVKFEVEIF